MAKAAIYATAEERTFIYLFKYSSITMRDGKKDISLQWPVSIKVWDHWYVCQPRLDGAHCWLSIYRFFFSAISRRIQQSFLDLITVVIAYVGIDERRQSVVVRPVLKRFLANVFPEHFFLKNEKHYGVAMVWLSFQNGRNIWFNVRAHTTVNSI